jgi:hypothetical protein
MRKWILSVICIVLGWGVHAQNDSTVIKERRNIIKWNLTPSALVGPGSFVLSYERVLKNKNTFSVGGGFLKAAPRTNKYGETVQFFGTVDRGGFDVNADYRFYFKKRNANPVPDGLYWGPYASVYNLNFKGNSEIYMDGQPTNKVALSSQLYMYNLGVQLGYQFIIKDRLAIDLFLVGPSFTHYDFRAQFDADSPIDPNSDFYQAFEKLLSTMLPGSEVILDQIDFSTSGRANTNFIAYRYGVQIGYKF